MTRETTEREVEVANDAASSVSPVAPADATGHAPWPRWRKILAYGALALLALAWIWLIDRKVFQLQTGPDAAPSPVSIQP